MSQKKAPHAFAATSPEPATGGKPSVHHREGSAVPLRPSNRANVEARKSHSSPTDACGKNSAENKNKNERKKACAPRSAAINTGDDTENNDERVAGAEGRDIKLAAAGQAKNTSVAPVGKGNGANRAVRSKENSAGVAAHAALSVGDKGKNAGEVSGVEGREAIVAAAAAGKGKNTSGAARNKGDTGRTAVGDEGNSCRGATSAASAADDIANAGHGGAGRHVSKERSGNLKKRLFAEIDNLRIKSSERSQATQQVNAVVQHFLEHIRTHGKGCFSSIKKLATGSSYENVKIWKPNEFDIMVVIPVERIECRVVDSEGGFYQAVLKRCPNKIRFKDFVCDEMISSKKMLSYFRELIKDAAKLSEYTLELERKKPESPAVTVIIRGEQMSISLDLVLALEVNAQSWPQHTTDGLKIDNWLGKKFRTELRRKPFYLVPKPQPGGAQTQSQEETWRISFSNIEKMLILSHGNSKNCCEKGSSKCCRKPCLKLLKDLINALKERHPRILAHVSSYHAKTAFFHACAARPKDEMWSLENIDECFLLLLDIFVEHLKNTHLPHFFIPTYNLFAPQIFDSRCRIKLLQFIETEKTNEFPFFGKSDGKQ